MSINIKQSVRCPKCGQMSDVTVWSSITVNDSQDLKKDLLAGKINMFRCPICDTAALMPHPMLYTDEEKRLMISFSPTNDAVVKQQLFDNIQTASRQSGELDKLAGYNLRFVSDYNELLEKILIFDSGLNDKAVEVIKLMVLSQEVDKSEQRVCHFGKLENDNIEFMIHDFIENMVTVGAVLAAFAIEEFLIPSTILDGGITGISMILDKITPLNMSIFIVILNLPFLVIGLKQLGIPFFIRGIYGMILFSAMLETFHELANVTETELLAVVFGGIILGAGVGLVLRYGGCLDGTEIIALLISKKTSFSIGQIILFANIIIYASAGILFGWDRAMYSLLTYFITFKVIDIVEQGMEQAKAIMIITNNGRRAAEEIYNRLGRTCTILDGKGFVSGKKDILYCVITRMEISEIKHIVHESDHSAFVTVTDISEIIGSHIKSKDANIIAE